MSKTATAQTHAFQAEVQQLLHLMIHSLYSNKEIFLRELISNASDACDRLRFASLTDKSLLEQDQEFGIWVEFDADSHTVSIRDNGIGMTQDEVIDNIGTIARSGTKAFLEQMAAPKSSDATENKSQQAELIGQFGVGFYSSFLVAEQVTLLTRKAGAAPTEGVQWHSDGSGEYSIQPIERTARGTLITLKLKPEASEYAERTRITYIIGKYSDHISLPIYIPKPPPAPDAQADDSAETAAETDTQADTEADTQADTQADTKTDTQTDTEADTAAETEADAAKGKGKAKKKSKAKAKKAPAEAEVVTPAIEWETINQGSALWTRAKNKISEEEHNAFYTSLTYDSQPPAVTLHNRVEGKMEYISLFYIPAKAPFDLWDRQRHYGIKLYVRRIFIADDAKNLMPNYLRFVRGLIDSADLPLNVSREFLQQNDQIDKIRAASVKKILSELQKIADKDADRYQAIWNEYNRALKEGVVEDHDNRDSLAKLSRFATTHNDDQAGDKNQTVSLDDYIARMAEKQNAIYYVSAESHSAAQRSPHLEVFRKNDIEVLLLSDPIDEWLVNSLPRYADKPLQSIAKGDLDINDLTRAEDEKKPDPEKQQEELQPLLDKIKSILDNKVKDVKISHRLVDSPSCLVVEKHDMSSNMERIMQSTGQSMGQTKPILELNAEHAFIKRLTPEHAELEDWANVLFDQAALAEGASLKEPSAYVARVNKLLAQ